MIKTKKATKGNLLIIYKLQFLIGTIKTFFRARPCHSKNPVSIPHRYDQNKYVMKATYGASIQFQFLIGTIKTEGITKAEQAQQIAFQFLIGTIKTSQSGHFIPFPSLFQFLIGTIKTAAGMRGRVAMFRVSIPHRYDQNGVPAKLLERARCVSIPHRYDQNNLLASESFGDNGVSIPHRYDQNAVLGTVGIGLGVSFNSS